MLAVLLAVMQLHPLTVQRLVLANKRRREKNFQFLQKLKSPRTKLVLQWAATASKFITGGGNTKTKNKVDVTSSDSKSQVGDSYVTTTMGKIKVKTGGKKEKNVEEIMQDFLEEKDKETSHYFIDKLGRKDSAVLKRLLLSKSDDSESDGKKHPKHECEEESESDGVRTKVP